MKTKLEFLLVCAFFTLAAISTSHGQDMLNRLNKVLNEYRETAPKERVHILTDRDVYAPGDKIWLHATVYELFATNVSKASAELSLVILDGENTQVYRRAFSTVEGRISECILLPNGLREGVYYLRGETNLSGGANYLYRKILIKEKIVPAFVIEADFENQILIPGDDFPVTFTFKDYYNEPMRNITYRIDYFDGNNRVSGVEGRVKKGGMAPINVKVPMKLKTGLFSYKVTATTKGKEAKLEGGFPVLTGNIFVDFYPENGILINGIASRVHVFSCDATGEPLAVEADLLENGNVVTTFFTDSDGLGTVELMPELEKRYSVQLKKPLLLDQLYALPEVKPKGVALRVVEKSPTKVSYQLISAYNDPRDIYLVGTAGNQIFYLSEHQINKELTLDVPLDKVKGDLAHFMVLNAVARIEGEHMLALSCTGMQPLKIREIETAIEPRGKVSYQVDESGLGNGELLISVVNEPWLAPVLGNQELCALTMPFDSEHQMVFQSSHFHHSVVSDQNWEKYVSYYMPVAFAWSRVLDTEGAFVPKQPNPLVNNNLSISDQLMGKSQVHYVDGRIRHSNLLIDPYFTTSNPEYTSKLYQEKVKKKPAYKTMLENGTPVLDVIQAIKPYKLEGNLIIFYGSANSLNFQGGALIAIDGVNRGTDASVIANLSPYDVEEIYCSTSTSDILRYTGFNTVGVVEITMKSGKTSDAEEDIRVSCADYEWPDYEKRGTDVDEDTRSTLLWDVIHVKGSSNVRDLSYFNSDLISGVKGRIYFLPESGTPRLSEFEYEIRK